MLFWAEGTKREDGLAFGNSDPRMVRMFLALLRRCYDIDESKFRCTVMCRADQDVDGLQAFWSEVTGIGAQSFYRARVDKRSVGRPTLRKGYKGVCLINYFSAKIARELCQIPKLVFLGH